VAYTEIPRLRLGGCGPYLVPHPPRAYKLVSLERFRAKANFADWRRT
jgi:hypothetical protein